MDDAVRGFELPGRFCSVVRFFFVSFDFMIGLGLNAFGFVDGRVILGEIRGVHVCTSPLPPGGALCGVSTLCVVPGLLSNLDSNPSNLESLDCSSSIYVFENRYDWCAFLGK